MRHQEEVVPTILAKVIAFDDIEEAAVSSPATKPSPFTLCKGIIRGIG
jgi:hypothetical protein